MTPWWREAVFYQIYPRSFADANGDGVGDLRGIIGRLDHLVDLGIDAVWLSPIFRSPMADFGYDVADYTEVDPVFGTNTDLMDLIDALHSRGLRLILDWVPNHTSDQHPWFVESRSTRDNPKRDWYVWRDRKPSGDPPSNWTATFNEIPAWTHDDATDQSYLHLFLPEQPDLNWANPEAEAAMHDTLRYWLDRGVDGFRADVVHLIGKGRDVDDLPERAAALPILAIDRPEGHQRLRRIRALLDDYPQEPMMVGEVYLLGPGQTASYLGDPAAGCGELHLSFDFRPLHATWDAAELHTAITVLELDFAEPRWPTWVLSNHDQPRQATRYGTAARARAAAVLSLTVRGTPFLYAGEELGLLDADVASDRLCDPAGRDGCRAPIPWAAAGDDEHGHGWASPPWLPFPANASTHAVDRQIDDPSSMLALYRALISLRKEHAALRLGTMALAPLDGAVLRYERAYGETRFTILINTGEERSPWPSDVTGEPLLRTGTGTGPERELDSCEAVIIETAPIERTEKRSAHHRIGIIVCDHFPPETREVAGGDVGDLYRHLLGAAEPTLEFRDYDAGNGELPASLDECDAWIITGSAADAHGDDPWVLALLDWIRRATAHVRMAGICFGHQAIAQALGGQVERAAGWSVGPHTFELGTTRWFAGEAVTINAMHRDEVTRLPPGVSHLGSGTTGTTAAFLVGDHTMCIQDHPEFDAALTSYLISTREDRIGATVAAQGLARSETTATDGEVVGRWLVDFLLDRRQ